MTEKMSKNIITMLNLADKTGVFQLEMFNKIEKELGKEAAEQAKYYSIPTSPMTHQIIKAFYFRRGWNTDWIIWDKDNFQDGALDCFKDNWAYAITLAVLYLAETDKRERESLEKNLDKLISSDNDFKKDIYKDALIKFVRNRFMKNGEFRKFDVVVSNPPYQIDVAKSERSHGARNSVDVFPAFQKAASLLGKQTTLIYPATFQNNINAKNSLFSFLINNNLRNIDNYEGAEIFGNAIKKGYVVNIVSCYETNDDKDIFYVNGIKHRYDTNILITTEKINTLYKATKDARKLSVSLKNYVNLSNLDEYNYDYSDKKTNNFNTSIYIKKKPGKQADATTVYVNKDEISEYIKDKELLDKYNVSIQSAPIGRQSIFNAEIFNKKTWNSKIFKPGETFGKTYIIVKSFDTLEEAENFSKYMNTEFFTLLSSLAYRKDGFVNTVPDLVDYTDKNKDINWGEPLNNQLLEFFKIDEIES